MAITRNPNNKKLFEKVTKIVRDKYKNKLTAYALSLIIRVYKSEGGVLVDNEKRNKDKEKAMMLDRLREMFSTFGDPQYNKKYKLLGWENKNKTSTRPDELFQEIFHNGYSFVGTTKNEYPLLVENLCLDTLSYCDNNNEVVSRIVDIDNIKKDSGVLISSIKYCIFLEDESGDYPDWESVPDASVEEDGLIICFDMKGNHIIITDDLLLYLLWGWRYIQLPQKGAENGELSSK